MDAEFKQYLKDLYGNPTTVGCLGDTNDWERAIRKDCLYKIYTKDLREWLKSNDTAP